MTGPHLHPVFHRNATALGGNPETPRSSSARGQALVLVVIAFFAIVAMVGLVIDGGNAFAQQRLTQNWTDGAAQAGAVQLMRRLVGVPGSDAQWDQRVVDAVTSYVRGEGLGTIGSIDYTDEDGTVLGPAGTGTIPDGTWGVHVRASRAFTTYVAGAIGLTSFTATTEATAIAGYAQSSGLGGVIPVTFPVLTAICNGQNLLTVGGTWPVGPQNPVVVPLCGNSPGNVGWIDWTPTAGGASELADAIRNPNNPPITTPRWYFVTATGNINSSQVQTALEWWIGKDMLLPIFYADQNDPLPGTCNREPADPKTSVTDCPDANRGGNGQQQWYFLVTFASFHLQEVHVQGNSQACDTGNGATSCLIGYFTNDVAPANVTVGPGTSGTTSFTPAAVQLIK